MSLKQFNKILIHTCTVYRATESQSTSGEVEKTFSANESGVVCRLVRQVERVASESVSAENLLVDILIANIGEDIQVGDRVGAFLLKADSSSYEAGTYEVRTKVQRNTHRAHHLVFELEQLK